MGAFTKHILQVKEEKMWLLLSRKPFTIILKKLTHAKTDRQIRLMIG